jgi:transcriptional regulator with XRE-family HTH domain
MIYAPKGSDFMTTGEKIKQLRKQLGMTQEELGNLIGVKKAAINKYETGAVVNLKRSTIDSLARALHVSPVELLSPDDPPPDDQPKNDDVRLLVRGLNKLTPEQLEQATNMMKIMFAKYADYFDKENNDHDDA